MPPAPTPKGVYRPLVVCRKLAFTAGHLPVTPQGELITGRVGDELDLETGYQAAQWAAYGILATLRRELGSLDRIAQVVKVLGVVNCTSDFTHHPSIVNGCSELFAEIFGPEAGVGARSAIGTNSLPLGVPVEIEAIFEVK